MAHTDSSAHDEHAEGPRAARYWIVWVLLLIATVLTFALSRVHVPPPFHLVIALVIACTKSMLVVLFFMHLWDHGGANRLVFGTSIFFVALLIGLVVLDNSARFVLVNPPHRATLRFEPPGPDILSPRGPPEAAPEPGLPAFEPRPQHGAADDTPDTRGR